MPKRNGGGEGENADGFYSELGRRVRIARGPRSQQEIAEMVGLSRTSITNIECGRQKLLLHTFARLADALSVPASELLPPSAPWPQTSLPPIDLSHYSRDEKVFVEAVVGKAKRMKKPNP